MAEEAQYESHKRKYDEDTSPPRSRRPTGFSDGPPPSAAPYSSVPPPLEDFELAKQKVLELASQAKRSKFENGGFTSNVNVLSEQKSLASNIQVGGTAPSYSGSKKIEIPNGRVGVIIGKAGETIKNLQLQSGARIQVTRDAEHDPNMPNRTVELMGNQDQIDKAEQLINQVIAEADTGGPGTVSRRLPGATGSEPFVLRVPNNKVGLVIGKGGETIKNIQSRSGARVQVIPLHLPPGDPSMERTVQIDGTSEQIEIAKQMVNEVIENDVRQISVKELLWNFAPPDNMKGCTRKLVKEASSLLSNRNRNPAMTGGYPQQNYQAQPPTSWAPQQPQMQQPGGYGYMQQPGVYPGASSQYNQQPYPGYPSLNWDQSGAPQNQQPPQGTGYDYYGQQQHPTQQQQQQPQPPHGSQSGNTGYIYNQPPTSGGYAQQGYSQDGYGGGYPGYSQPPANPQSGFDQRQGYGSTPGYGNATNPPTQERHPPAYGTQGETGQTPSSGQPQQGYMVGQHSNPAYPAEPGYGVPPTSQPSYGTPSVPQGGGYPGYGTPQVQKTPPNPSAYGQPQQSSSQVGGYAPPASGQPGYPPSQPSAQSGAAAAAATAAATATYGAGTTQSGSYPQAWAPPATAQGYAQQPYYGGAYSQPSAYPADDNGVTAAPTPASQPPAQSNGAAKASPASL